MVLMAVGIRVPILLEGTTTPKMVTQVPILLEAITTANGVIQVPILLEAITTARLVIQVLILLEVITTLTQAIQAQTLLVVPIMVEEESNYLFGQQRSRCNPTVRGVITTALLLFDL